MRLRTALLGGMALLLVLLTVPRAAVAGDPYAADPLRLVPFADTVQQTYTSGTDDWEVWVCRSGGALPTVDLGPTVTGLNANVTPYFEWVSGGRYSPTFRAGGEVTTDQFLDPDPSAPETPFAQPCVDLVAAASTSGPNGVVIVTDNPVDEGYATAGAVCPESPFSGCTDTYPANARIVVLGAATVKIIPPFAEPQWITAAHEIGHAINWAHSYSGLTTDPDTGLISRYDNPMDVMSGGIHMGDPIGTIAYDRYAAGWIDPADVAVHTSGIGLYDLSASRTSGLQMVVIPTGTDGHFFTIDARRRTDYDAALPTSGAEVYEIDQRREIACVIPASWPSTWPCFATFVRITPTPPVEGMTSTAHVLGIDDQIRVGGFSVSVVAASTTAITVRVSEVDSGRFVDDDGNIHEANIEAIAAAGITLGCNPPDNDRYCPSDGVTRAQMAAFLVRAIGEADNLFPYQGYFTDVPEGQWYTPYVEVLGFLGISEGYGDGTFHPDAIVTRAEMATFLVRAFPWIDVVVPQQVFSDVPVGSWYEANVEAIFQAGITKGCDVDPLRYCPDDQVKRDQMASFLARALGIGT